MSSDEDEVNRDESLQGKALERFQRIGRALGLEGSRDGSRSRSMESNEAQPEDISAISATRGSAVRTIVDVRESDTLQGTEQRRRRAGRVLGDGSQEQEQTIAKKRQKLTADQKIMAREHKKAEEEFETRTKLQGTTDRQASNKDDIQSLLLGIEEAERYQHAEARRLAEKKLLELNQESEEKLQKNREEYDAIQAKRAELEAILREKQRLEELALANANFRKEHRSWLLPTAGMLGMESEMELLVKDENGVLNFSAHLISARDAAIEQLETFVGKKEVNFDELKAEHTFLKLISLYYMKFDTFRTLRQGTKKQLGTNLNTDIDRLLFKLLLRTFGRTSEDISALFLGKLNDCGGCLC